MLVNIYQNFEWAAVDETTNRRKQSLPKSDLLLRAETPSH